MIVVSKDAEIKILHELRRGHKRHVRQLCFLLRLSKINGPKRDIFESFLRLFLENTNAYLGRVYICQDQDVFIMMPEFDETDFAKFLIALSEATGIEDIKNAGRAFKVEIQWSELENFLNRKIEVLDNKKIAEQERQRHEDAVKNNDELFRNMDQNLISTISKRRIQRRNTIIMIADDDQLSRTIAANVLRESHNIAIAKDGKSAIREYIETAPDVLFLDIDMPDMTGYEVLDFIFRVDQYAFVVMFSSRKDKSNMMKAVDLGAQGFVGKPFTRENLFHHVAISPFIRAKRPAKERDVGAR